MKYRIYDVTLSPGCCHLEVAVWPSEQFENELFDSIDEFIAQHLQGKTLVSMENAPLYRHGDHPYTHVYDLRGYARFYREPQFLAWIDEDGLAHYLMVAAVVG